jgi:hypothetical protein
MYIKVENERQVERLAQLAKEIWTNHFGLMFTRDILDVIIETIQSKEAIAKQMDDGLLYYLIPGKHSPVGYFAYRLSESKDELFLNFESGVVPRTQMICHLFPEHNTS